MEVVKENSVYKRLLTHRTRTVFMGSPSPYPVHYFGVEGIGPYHFLMSLTDSERGELMEALGVDALVALNVNVMLNRQDKVSVGRVSLGTYRPSSFSKISMMNRDETIWSDQMASGEQSQGSTTHLSGITDYSVLEKISLILPKNLSRPFGGTIISKGGSGELVF